MDFMNFMDQDFDVKLSKAVKEDTMHEKMKEEMKEKMNDNMTDKMRNDMINELRPLAMAYIPMQKWGTIYDPAKGLKQGTIFPDLDFPFLGREMSSK